MKRYSAKLVGVIVLLVIGVVLVSSAVYAMSFANNDHTMPEGMEHAFTGSHTHEDGHPETFHSNGGNYTAGCPMQHG